MNTLYVLCDAEGVSQDNPIYGIFTSYDFASEAADELCNKWTDDLLAAPPEETGLTPEDRDWVFNDCHKALIIHAIEDIDRLFYH